jgi:imidazolonepropionase-like amidohydrolase
VSAWRTLLAAFVLSSALAAEAQTIVVRGGTVLTVTQGTLENATIVIRDGKIAAVGVDVSTPPGATVIDASGAFVMPGIIDAHSHIAAESINEGSVSVSSMTGIRDVLDPTDIAIYRELAGGVTTSNVLHGSANPIGGKNVVIKHRWGKGAAGLIFEGAPPGIKFAMGENPKRSRGTPAGVPKRYPQTRMGVIDVMREAFTKARAYEKTWKEYEARKAAGEPDLVPPRRDLELEPLVEVLEGKRLVHAHCYRADEIVQLLRVAEEFGFRIATLQHVLEGYKVADEIAAHGAGASTFSDWWAYKVEAYDAIPYNAALMTERGVLVSINSDSDEEARHLNQEAAKTMKWGGLTEDQALALITINPAKQLRIDRWVGSIEAGKDADLAIFDKHPLSVYAVVQKVLIDGEVYFDREKDLARRRALEEEHKSLLEKASEGDRW